MAPFRFYCPCPRNILMESDTSQVGQQCLCPTCGLQFIVPHPDPNLAAAGQMAGYGSYPPASGQVAPPYAPPPQPYAPPPPPGQAYVPGYAAPPPAVAEIHVPSPPAPEFDLTNPQDDPNRVVTVICPTGCELETPMSMIGTDAMCPQCNVQFRLRYEDTLEYKEEQEREKQRREEQFSQNALKWAIITAVLVGIAIIGMFVMVAMR